MRSDIIEDLRPYYLKHKFEISQLLNNPKMKTVCDRYFIYNTHPVAIALKFKLPIFEVKRLLISACGKMIRNR